MTQTRSKVMLPIGNRPFMEHSIRSLAKNNVHDLIVVVGYQKEKIMDHFGDGLRYGVKIDYVTQDRQLGTADALNKAKFYVDGPFLVVNGDNLVDKQTIKDVYSADGDNVILATARSHAGNYGVLTVEQEHVTRILEKPGRSCSGIMNTGVYKFSSDIFEELPQTPLSERGSYELTQTITQMIQKGYDIRYKLTTGVWADAIFAWDLLDANSSALSIREHKVEGVIEEGAWCRGPVEIGPGSVIRSGSYIMGPVSIGSNCDIGPNVTISPSTTLGDSVRVGSHSVIRNCILMNGTRIGAGTILADSVIGVSTSFGDNLIVESGKSIVPIEDEIHQAEFGAIVADNVTMGSKVFMHPGTIIGTSSIVGSGAKLRGWIERGSRVI